MASGRRRAQPAAVIVATEIMQRAASRESRIGGDYSCKEDKDKHNSEASHWKPPLNIKLYRTIPVERPL